MPHTLAFFSSYLLAKKKFKIKIFKKSSVVVDYLSKNVKKKKFGGQWKCRVDENETIVEKSEKKKRTRLQSVTAQRKILIMNTY